MKIPHPLLAVLATAITSQGAALSPTTTSLPSPPLPPWYPLEPWQISALHSRNPHKSPYGVNASSLVLTVANPKRVAAAPAPHGSGGGYVVFGNSTATCEIHWSTDSATPYGYSSVACTPAQLDGNGQGGDTYVPYWTMTLNEVHEDLSSPGDHYLALSFELVHNATVYGQKAYKRMTGAVTLRSAGAGANLQGNCGDGANGECVYDLKDGAAPVLFQPTLQECRFACG
ncbi:hypothetical protein F5Y17DRAFT_438866 [Xylariaceae sp. FL0594]|nr:hypothetical protein F5Y17DRAFT_438866 [Xylariaceae sp. FL0594]